MEVNKGGMVHKNQGLGLVVGQLSLVIGYYE
jgi:hypothetical protein